MIKTKQNLFIPPIVVAMRKSIPLLCALLFLCGTSWAFDIWVDDDSQASNPDGTSGYPFSQIQEAVNLASTLTGYVTIRVRPGVYEPFRIDSILTCDLEVKSEFSRMATIDGDETSTPIEVRNCGSTIMISGFVIINGFADNSLTETGTYYTYDYASHEFYAHDRTVTYDSAGGGIFAWRASSLYISDCSFEDNVGAQGSAVFVCRTEVDIADCDFVGNGYGSYLENHPNSNVIGAAICSIASDINLSRLIIKDNGQVINPSSDYYLGDRDIIHIEQFEEDERYTFSIKDCLIYNNASTRDVVYAKSYACTMECTHNTITGNAMIYGATVRLESLGFGLSYFEVTLINNIIRQNTTEFFSEDVDMNDRQIYRSPFDLVSLMMYNNNCHDVSLICDNLQWVDVFVDNIDEDPCFTDPDYANYSLQWNETNRSPCILSGYNFTPVVHHYYDRPDMGAIQYVGSPHEFITYEFPSYSERNGLKWMSFPTLDRIWNPATNEPDVANTFFTPIMEDDVLQSITWKVLNYSEQDIHYNSSTQLWEGDLSHYIVPQQGYKIQMAQGLLNQQSIAVPGTIPIVNQNPLNIKAQPASKAEEIGNENWLGYFHPTTVNAREAFEGVMSNLWSIQTQNWTMVRENMVPGSPWIIALQQGKEPTLSYGDMVIVKCFEDASFHWNTEAVAQIPIEKELPSHFVYEEKPDYIPLYVEVDSSDLPSELALYVDDVCKGAAVVCDSLVEIPGYIVDDINPDAEVEIRAYYADKAAVDQIPAFRVWNNTSGVYENKPLVLNRKNYYYKVKIAKGEGETPVASLATMEIYPNPFNPSTTIRFSLPEATEITLEVYNLKGQLVRTLAKGIADSGRQSVSWDGTDNQNRRVGSGLYYSKLSYQNKSLVQKMVMMK
jgi:hypothetical protein